MNRQQTDHDLEVDDSLNWADFVDALRRQGSRKEVLVAQKIKGRRMRDSYLDHVTLFRLVRPHSDER